MQYVTTFDINTLPDIETVRNHKTSKCAYNNATNTKNNKKKKKIKKSFENVLTL